MQASQFFTVLLLVISLNATAQDEKNNAQNFKVIHTVLFKFLPATSVEQIEKLTTGILKLKGTVPGIGSVSYGENFSERSLGFTYAVTISFRDIASLETFYKHPDHKKLIKDCILPIKAEMLIIDYENKDTK